MQIQTATSLQPAFLRGPLSHWEGWLIRTRCALSTCPPNRLIGVEEMLEARGDMSVADMAGRMRCGICGRAAARVALVRSCLAGEIVNPVRGAAF